MKVLLIVKKEWDSNSLFFYFRFILIKVVIFHFFIFFNFECLFICES